MNHLHPSVKLTDRHNWDKISVTRGDQQLGSLYMLRQCLQLWEDEMGTGLQWLGGETGSEIDATDPSKETKQTLNQAQQ